MTKNELLNILLSGVDNWNKWRRENIDIPLDFTNINLNRNDFSGYDLVSADFSGSSLVRTKFCKAQLFGAKFRGANLLSVDFQGAQLMNADLSTSNANGVDFRNSFLLGSSLENSSLVNCKYNRWAIFRGIRLNGCYGNQSFMRFALDQSFIEEFRGETAARPLITTDEKFHSIKQSFAFAKTAPSPVSKPKWYLYLLWSISSDCGRSFFLWLIWSLLIAMSFGLIYALNPELIEVTQREPSVVTPYYFSIVTFTTLGFGDVLPKNIYGEIILTAEVVLGYVMLGGLISIFSTKVARRAA